MISQADVAPLELAAIPPTLTIVVALAVEHACLRHALGGERDCVVVMQSGPGPAHAEQAARRAVANGAMTLMSFGLAGALDTRLEPGAVVLADRVVTETGQHAGIDAGWREGLALQLNGAFALAHGTLLSTNRVLESPREKAAASAAHAAIACDMESAAIGAVAGSAAIPFVALRVIVDRATDHLPAHVSGWVDAAGNTRFAPMLATMRRPGQWHATWVLASRFGTARKVLSRLGPELRAVAVDRAAQSG